MTRYRGRSPYGVFPLAREVSRHIGAQSALSFVSAYTTLSQAIPGFSNHPP
jgi:hypothetical protein